MHGKGSTESIHFFVPSRNTCKNASKSALNLVTPLLASVGMRLFTILFFLLFKKKINKNKKISSLCGLIPTLSKINYELPLTPEGFGSGPVEVGLQQV